MPKFDKVMFLALPRIEDKRGTLSIIEQCNHIPFIIKNVRWYSLKSEPVSLDIFTLSDRCLVPLSGDINLTVSDQTDVRNYTLNSESSALYVPCGLLVDVTDFSEDAVLLVLSSDFYEI